jgi:hypothetical protein
MLMKSLILTLSLFSFTIQAQTEQQIIQAQIREAQGITSQWLKKQKQGLARRDIFQGQAERADYIISGIPAQVKTLNPAGMTFRHYIGSNMPIILQSSQLKTGITPYVIMNPGYSREVYEDLVGIFLTTPQTPPERVGLARNPNADYIDFELYPGTPVVFIEKEIFLIPGRPDLPAWLKSLYLEYKRTGRVDTQYVDLFRKVDERGGVNPTFMKVRIKSYRMNGKLVENVSCPVSC